MGNILIPPKVKRRSLCIRIYPWKFHRMLPVACHTWRLLLRKAKGDLSPPLPCALQHSPQDTQVSGMVERGGLHSWWVSEQGSSAGLMCCSRENFSGLELQALTFLSAPAKVGTALSRLGWAGREPPTSVGLKSLAEEFHCGAWCRRRRVCRPEGCCGQVCLEAHPVCCFCAVRLALSWGVFRGQQVFKQPQGGAQLEAASPSMQGAPITGTRLSVKPCLCFKETSQHKAVE